MNKDKARRKIKVCCSHFFLIVIGMLWIYPFLWMISASFKDQGEFFKIA